MSHEGDSCRGIEEEEDKETCTKLSVIPVTKKDI